MKKSTKILIAVLVITALLPACAYTPTWVGVGRRTYQLGELEPYAAAKNKVPVVPSGYTRIYIYRPQTFVGMFGSAVVIVNGKWMGDKENPFGDNLLLPGTVFIVDSAADVTRVWWYQAGKGEELDKALSLPSTEARARYLRWGMKPTYGYLEIVSEQQAMTEIESLHFSGYVKLDSP